MSAELNGQIPLFRLIESPGDNSDYPRSYAREQMAYIKAMRVGSIAVEQALAVGQAEEDSGEENADS